MIGDIAHYLTAFIARAGQRKEAVTCSRSGKQHKASYWMNVNGMNEHKKVICYSSHLTLHIEKEGKKKECK